MLTIFLLLGLPLLGIAIYPFVARYKSFYTGFSSALGMVAWVVSVMALLLTEGQAMRLNTGWFKAGSFMPDLTLTLDMHALLMLGVVSTVAFAVQVFSQAYMRNDSRIATYYLYLHFFVLAMFLLVLSSNLLITFVAWELVGFSSWLLIGFWYERPKAVFASRKAFLVNRIGDAGFVLAIGILLALFNSMDYATIQQVFSGASGFNSGLLILTDGDAYPSYTIVSQFWLTWAGAGLVLAVMAKSAQYPLAVWLPDAMQGPTPVSALIHAATMVAAGVYLLLRFQFFFTPELLQSLIIIGSITAFMGAFAAFAQHDIKKILAYSTVSQLGYMVLAMGLGAWGAGFYHLITHAFFKAGLFLLAGALIWLAHQNKAMKDEQDIREMGGMLRAFPILHALFLIFAAALAGIPLFSGFYSKEAILEALFQGQGSLDGAWYLVPFLVWLAVPMTFLYMIRLWKYLYFGEAYDWKALQLRVPPAFLVPLVLLALLSLGIWQGLGLDFSSNFIYERIISSSPFIRAGSDAWVHGANEGHWVTYLSLLLLASAAAMAWLFFFFLKDRLQVPKFLRSLSINNWYLDKIHHFLLVRPMLQAGKGLAWLDQKFIDPAVEIPAKTTVILASIIAWVDRKVVDALVKGLAGLASFTGRLVGIGKHSGMQDVVLLAFGLFLIIMLWLVF